MVEKDGAADDGAGLVKYEISLMKTGTGRPAPVFLRRSRQKKGVRDVEIESGERVRV